MAKATVDRVRSGIGSESQVNEHRVESGTGIAEDIAGRVDIGKRPKYRESQVQVRSIRRSASIEKHSDLCRSTRNDGA